MLSTAIEPVAFGDGTYTLALPLKQIIEIERNCGAADRDGVLRTKSIYVIHDELAAGLGQQADETAVYIGGGSTHPSDVREVLRCALIGGNNGVVAGEEIDVGPAKAVQLVDEYLYPHRPLIEGQLLAWAVLNAAIKGIVLKKKVRGEPDEQAGAGFERGQVLANCGELGLDWERVSLGEYAEALDAHNAAYDEAKGPTAKDMDRLKRFRSARSVH